MRISCFAIALVLAPAACSHVEDKTYPPSTVTKRALLGNALDILFVIDNSASTTDKQTVFAENFPRFVQALDAFPQGRPNLHIGIVTTTVDIGVQDVSGCPSPNPDDDGLLVNAPRVLFACANGATPPTGRFFSDLKNNSGGRTTNYAGDLSDALSCIGQVGVKGCGFEAPLEAMKRALDGSRPENAGFVRDDADLAIVILTDEDDCSDADPALFALGSGDSGPGDFRCQPLEAYDCDTPISATDGGTYKNCQVRRTGYLHDPQDYVKFLATVKDPSQTFVGLIAGDVTTTIKTGPITSPFMQSLALEPSCQATINGNPAMGRPALRLADFMQSYSDRGTFETVCQPDYSNALTTFSSGMFAMMSPCLESGIATADRDPNNAGLQLDCTVTDRDAANNVVGAPFLPCQMTDDHTPSGSGPQPCYWLEANAPACAITSTQLELHMQRVVPPDPSIVVTQVTCQSGQ